MNVVLPTYVFYDAMPLRLEYCAHCDRMTLKHERDAGECITNSGLGPLQMWHPNEGIGIVRSCELQGHRLALLFCAQCKRAKPDHPNAKCLFMATSFTPTEVLISYSGETA